MFDPVLFVVPLGVTVVFIGAVEPCDVDGCGVVVVVVVDDVVVGASVVFAFVGGRVDVTGFAAEVLDVIF